MKKILLVISLLALVFGVAAYTTGIVVDYKGCKKADISMRWFGYDHEYMMWMFISGERVAIERGTGVFDIEYTYKGEGRHKVAVYVFQLKGSRYGIIHVEAKMIELGHVPFAWNTQQGHNTFRLR